MIQKLILLKLNFQILERPFKYIDNPYFDGMVTQIDPTELHLNKANSTDNEAPF